MTPQELKELRCCVLVPTYNNAPLIEPVLLDLVPFASDVIIVNDGSTDATSEILKLHPEFDVVNHSINRGKGIALKTGFKRAIDKGYENILTIDSDGQHKVSDFEVFKKAMEEHPGALLIGSRNLEAENMPGKNTFANRFSNFWFHLETGQKLPDTQSGYRLYPAQAVKKLRTFTSRYEFELEILVRAAWKGIKLVPITIDVYYPPKEERISHFRPLRDFTRISILNTILVLAALLWYRPLLLLRNLTWKNFKKFFKEKVVQTNETNGKKATAIGFGIFMGIIPVWGYQMILAVLLAHAFKLNKAIVLIASNISIGPMIPVVIYLSFLFGGLFMENPNELVFDPGQLNLNVVWEQLTQYLIGSISLSIIAGLTIGLISYLALSVFRKQAPAN